MLVTLAVQRSSLTGALLTLVDRRGVTVLFRFGLVTTSKLALTFVSLRGVSIKRFGPGEFALDDDRVSVLQGVLLATLDLTVLKNEPSLPTGFGFDPAVHYLNTNPDHRYAW